MRSMLKEVNKAPACSLPSTDKGGAGKVSLKDLAGQAVVLFFYPKDMTSGCTTEALDFTAASRKLKNRGAVVLGVSKDSLERHDKFIAKNNLNFALLSDEDGKVIEKYGAWGEKNNYGKKYMGIIRTTVIIDPAGKVAKVFPKVRVKGHVDAVLAALDEVRKS